MRSVVWDLNLASVTITNVTVWMQFVVFLRVYVCVQVCICCVLSLNIKIALFIQNWENGRIERKKRKQKHSKQSKATAAKANKTFTTCKWKMSRFFFHFRGVHSTRLIKQSMLIYVFVINSFSNSQFFFLSIFVVCVCVLLYVCASYFIFCICLFLSLFGVLCASRMQELYAFAIVTLWNAFTKTLRSLSTERENAMRKAATV